MVRKICFLSLLIPTLFAGDYVAIPHIAQDTQSFQSYIVLENRGPESLEAVMLGYDGDRSLGSASVELAPGERLHKAPAQLFEDQVPSHLFVSKDDNLYVGVEYVPVRQPENRTYVEGIREVAHRWRMFPSNWQKTFDGLVVTHPGCYRVDLSITQYDSQGELLAVIPMEAGALPGFGKLVFNLGRYLLDVEGSYVEVVASQGVAVMGLKGSLSGNDSFPFLVGNQAQAYPRFEEVLSEMRAMRSAWYRAEISDSYRYTLSTACYCPPSSAIVEVRDHILTSITRLDGSAVPLGETRVFRTASELYQLIEDSIASGVDDIHVTYHDNGLPAVIALDPHACAVDDEISYVIDEVENLD